MFTFSFPQKKSQGFWNNICVKNNNNIVTSIFGEYCSSQTKLCLQCRQQNKQHFAYFPKENMNSKKDNLGWCEGVRSKSVVLYNFPVDIFSLWLTVLIINKTLTLLFSSIFILSSPFLISHVLPPSVNSTPSFFTSCSLSMWARQVSRSLSPGTTMRPSGIAEMRMERERKH